MHTKVKAGGIIIQNKKVLALRDKGEDIFFTPGGGVDPGETPEQTIIRELKEEIDIIVAPEDITAFGTFTHPQGTDPSIMLEMKVFLINKWEGQIRPESEIEEILWVSSVNQDTVKLGSIFKEEILPRLKEQQLID